MHGRPRPRSRRRVTTAVGICFALFATGSAGLGATPDEPGSLVVTMVDPAGRPITNACLEVWTDAGGGTRGSRLGKGPCDADHVIDPKGVDPGPLDGLADGVLSFPGLARGSYVIVTVRPPSDPNGTYERLADRTVDVRAGAITPITLIHRLPDSLVIHKVDPAGAPLPGACFEIDGGRLATASGCDGPGSPAIAPGDGLADGILVLRGLSKGTFTLHELHAPPGYTPAPDQAIALPGGKQVEVTVTNTLGPATGGGGGLAVTIRDPLGAPVPNACFQVWTDAGGGVRGAIVPGKRACDAAIDGARIPAPADGIADGTLGFGGLARGRYVLAQTQVASDATGAYLPIPDRVATVRADGLTHVEITNAQARMVIIRTETDAGVLLPGSCFVLDGGRIGRSSGCDGAGGIGADFPIAGDGAPDGVIMLRGVEKGNIPLQQVRAPAGYGPAPDRAFTISGTAETQIVVTNTLGANTGSLVVTMVDPAARPITNACLEIWTDAGGGTRGSRLGKATCDADHVTDPRGVDPGPFDGLPDGVLSFPGLARGSYVIVTVRPPSDPNGTYERLADRTVDVRAGAITPITLIHRLPDSLVIHKVDPAGAPLPGACFEIDGGRLATASGCDGPGSPAIAPGDGLADGILVLRGLSKGTFTLHELHAPPGYTPAPDQAIALPGGKQVEVTVTNTLGPATGGGGGLGQVVSLELEVESRITIRALNGMTVTNGETTAVGRIPLQPGAGATWQGTGTLDSRDGLRSGGLPVDPGDRARCVRLAGSRGPCRPRACGRGDRGKHGQRADQRDAGSLPVRCLQRSLRGRAQHLGEPVLRRVPEPIPVGRLPCHRLDARWWRGRLDDRRPRRRGVMDWRLLDRICPRLHRPHHVPVVRSCGGRRHEPVALGDARDWWWSSRLAESRDRGEPGAIVAPRRHGPDRRCRWDSHGDRSRWRHRSVDRHRGVPLAADDGQPGHHSAASPARHRSADRGLREAAADRGLREAAADRGLREAAADRGLREAAADRGLRETAADRGLRQASPSVSDVSQLVDRRWSGWRLPAIHRRSTGLPDIIIRAFGQERSIAMAEAERALGSRGIRWFVDMNLARITADRLEPLVRIDLVAGVSIASDLLRRQRRADFVVGPGPATRLLAKHVRPVRRGGRLLDLGCGTGALGLVLGGVAIDVLGVDVNPRAVAFATFNASWNRRRQTRAEVGDFLTPDPDTRLNGRFDTVVANPPFVLAPSADLIYRDRSLPGDRVGARTVERVAGALAPGGRGYILCNWIDADGSDWAAPARAWVAGTGLDACLVRLGTHGPADYAAIWNRDLSPPDRDAEVARWTAALVGEGIARIHVGIIALGRQRVDRGSVPRVLALDRATTSVRYETLEQFLAGDDAPRVRRTGPPSAG